MITGEFLDLMPHRLEVQNYLGKDYYGNEQYDTSNPRQYNCLVDTTVTVSRSANAETHTVGLTAYVFSIPIGSDTPISISESDKAIILEPSLYGHRPIVNLARHYDRDGTLHNMVLTFS